MAAKTPQTYANHVRWDPLYHFFISPIVLILVLMSLWGVVRHHDLHSVLHLVLATAGFALVLKLRLYPLKAQDRVIRLEERLRLMTLLPEPMRARIPELTESQLVALRFASDGEVAGLVEKALAEKLSNDAIKKLIVNWRPDNFRV